MRAKNIVENDFICQWLVWNKCLGRECMLITACAKRISRALKKKLQISTLKCIFWTWQRTRNHCFYKYRCVSKLLSLPKDNSDVTLYLLEVLEQTFSHVVGNETDPRITFHRCWYCSNVTQKLGIDEMEFFPVLVLTNHIRLSVFWSSIC